MPSGYLISIPIPTYLDDLTSAAKEWTARKKAAINEKQKEVVEEVPPWE
jgi:hypothetical protein